MPARPAPALALLALCALATVPSASAFSTTGVDFQGNATLGLVRTEMKDNGVCDIIGGTGPMPPAANMVQTVRNDKGVIEGAKEWVPNGSLQASVPTDTTTASFSTTAAQATPTPTLQGTWMVQALCSVLHDACPDESTVPCVIEASSLPAWFADMPGPFTLVGRTG